MLPQQPGGFLRCAPATQCCPPLLGRFSPCCPSLLRCPCRISQLLIVFPIPGCFLCGAPQTGQAIIVKPWSAMLHPNAATAPGTGGRRPPCFLSELRPGGVLRKITSPSIAPKRRGLLEQTLSDEWPGCIRQYCVRPKKLKLLRAFSYADGRIFHIELIYSVQQKSEIHRNL